MTDIGKIVVVDDRIDEGQRIVDAIWRAGLSALFAHYDTSVWSGASNPYKEMSGVRVVFMDIDLLGGGMKGSGNQLYGIVEAALETLLHKENGPYALVTWTSFSNNAEALVAYLKDRLSIEKRPLVIEHLSKEEFEHLPPEHLLEKVRSLFSKKTAVQAIADWEVSVRHAASEIASEMVGAARQVSNTGEDGDLALTSFLWKLVRASGRDIAKDDFCYHLFAAMVPLLADRLAHLAHTSATARVPDEPRSEIDSETWRRRINSMLHLDMRGTGGGPGLILHYPEGDVFKTLPFRDDRQNLRKFVAAEVLNGYTRADKKTERPQMQEELQPVLMDITPPCDHANQKVRWRRFVAGSVVREKWWPYIYLDNKNAPLSASRTSDNLWVSPQMLIGDTPACIVFNGRLVASLPEEEYRQDSAHLRVFARLREQIFGHFLSWLGNHITRVGITELR